MAYGLPNQIPVANVSSLAFLTANFPPVSYINAVAVAAGVEYYSDGSSWRQFAAAGAVPTVFNYNPANYKNFRKALGNTLSGQASTALRVLCIGDSTTLGSNGVTATNAVQNSWVRRLADLLTKQGIQSGWQNNFGDHTAASSGSTIQLIDPRVTAIPAGWSTDDSGALTLTPGPGGWNFYNQTTTNPFTFTPTVQTDTCDVYYFDGSGYDPFLVKSGAAGVTTCSTGGTATIGATNVVRKLTSTFTLGSNVWTIQRAGTGTTLFLMGINCYNSTLPELSFINLGNGGKTTSFYTATASPWDTLSQMTSGAIAGSPLAIVNLGINDWLGATSIASFTASLTTIVTGLQAAGTDVLLTVPVPSSAASSSAVTQAAFSSAIYTVAIANNCAVIDLTARWVSNSVSNTLGLYGDSIIHPNFAFGYPDVALGMSNFFAAV